jgi:hypothetical protein
VAAYTFIGLLLALACLAGLAGLLLLVNPSLRQGAGYTGALDAVARGYLVAVPFTLLALLADLAFGWGAATAFIQAAIMTSGAAVGAELMRRSGQKITYMLAPMAGAFAFSIIWIAYSSIFTKEDSPAYMRCSLPHSYPAGAALLPAAARPFLRAAERGGFERKIYHLDGLPR